MQSKKSVLCFRGGTAGPGHGTYHIDRERLPGRKIERPVHVVRNVTICSSKSCGRVPIINICTVVLAPRALCGHGFVDPIVRFERVNCANISVSDSETRVDSRVISPIAEGNDSQHKPNPGKDELALADSYVT